VTKKSQEVDAYIVNAAGFAKPILRKIRSAFHKACPRVEETMRWSMPHFDHCGILGSMAAFKHHVSFGFWKGSQLKDPQGLFNGIGKTNMVMVKIGSIEELPSEKVLTSYIKEAARLNERETSAPKTKKARTSPKAAVVKKTMKPPKDLRAALLKNKKAKATFDRFSRSHRKEYVEWITEAKRPETRRKRLATAVQQMAAGKSKNWKYIKGAR